MIQCGHPLALPPDTGVRIVAREPFRASWAEDASGVIRRPSPISIDMPFEEMKAAEHLKRNTAVEAPDNFVIEVPNAVLVGERAVVTDHPNHLITDSAHPRHTAKIFKLAERRQFEAVQLEADEDFFHYAADACPRTRIDEEVILLNSMECGNYGAFLLRNIPKIIAIKQLALEQYRLIAPLYDQWHISTFNAFGINVDHIIPYRRGQIYDVNKLIIPSMRLAEFFLDDDSTDLFQSFAERISSPNSLANRPEKIYISRLTQGRLRPDYRRFMNEDELIEKLENLGFYIFEPEHHSFAEKVLTFAAARIVVGPSGAGMSNSVFCRPGTIILSIEPLPHWLTLHANIFASNKLTYAFVLGGADPDDPSIQKRWRADIDCVLKRIRYLL